MSSTRLPKDLVHLVGPRAVLSLAYWKGVISVHPLCQGDKKISLGSWNLRPSQVADPGLPQAPGGRRHAPRGALLLKSS